MPPLYIARHAETVFNQSGRMQGQHRHTPLTHTGIEQAHLMGKALLTHFGAHPVLDFWSSTAGRAQQTAAIIAEYLGIDFFDIRTDDRLQEIAVGEWENLSYKEVAKTQGLIVDPVRHLFVVRPPGGEWYDDVATRLQSWVADFHSTAALPKLVIAHGISSRILRGLLVGGSDFGGVKIAEDVPQGTVMRIDNGMEEVVILGSGSAGEHRSMNEVLH